MCLISGIFVSLGLIRYGIIFYWCQSWLVHLGFPLVVSHSSYKGRYLYFLGPSFFPPRNILSNSFHSNTPQHSSLATRSVTRPLPPILCKQLTVKSVNSEFGLYVSYLKKVDVSFRCWHFYILALCLAFCGITGYMPTSNQMPSFYPSAEMWAGKSVSILEKGGWGMSVAMRRCKYSWRVHFIYTRDRNTCSSWSMHDCNNLQSWVMSSQSVAK